MAFFCLLAAPLRLCVADVLYTWTAAKPDQTETEMASEELFLVLLSPAGLKTVALCGMEANLSGVNVNWEMQAYRECPTA